ncbi:MAG: hypothetical protein ACRD7E_29305 [Bryobacteraceae bacterium]
MSSWPGCLHEPARPFIQQWVAAEPTGQYARRTAFLYDWLTGDTLQMPERLGGNYVDAVDDVKLAAAAADRVRRRSRRRATTRAR